MGAIAVEVLDQDFCGIGLERDTICHSMSNWTISRLCRLVTVTVVDNRVLNDNIGRAINIPT